MKTITLLIKYIIQQLNYAHCGSVLLKGKALLMLSLLVSPFVYFKDMLFKIPETHFSFMGTVMFAIMIDHLMGSYLHFIKKEWSWKRNITGLLTKVFLCVSAYILFEMLRNIIKNEELIANYLEIVMKLVVFLYPFTSAMGNMSELTGGKFPPIGWIKKLEKFQETLNIKHFKNETDK